jgi:hypothetical protein
MFVEYKGIGSPEFQKSVEKLDQAIARLDRFNKLEKRFLELKRRGRALAWGNRKEALKKIIVKIEALQSEINLYN